MALRSAVQTFWKAYLTGHAAAAFGMVSGRCRMVMDRDIFIESSENAGKNLDDTFGGVSPHLVTFEAQVEGHRASVNYTFQISLSGKPDQLWVYERGDWRFDAC